MKTLEKLRKLKVQVASRMSCGGSRRPGQEVSSGSLESIPGSLEIILSVSFTCPGLLSVA